MKTVLWNLTKSMIKSPKKNNQPILSIIILNYNSGNYLANCLKSLYQSTINNYQIEIIVVDNASTDDSLSQTQSLKLFNPNILPLNYLPLPTNIGFSAGNNRGVTVSNPKSKYVLFLNPDTSVEKDTLSGMIDYFEKHPKVDAATCDVILALTGKTQLESHRGFPTPNNTFWHFFGFGLPKLFSKSKFFNGYFMGYLDYSKPQQIDCCVGAFFMLKRPVGDQLKWWNEKYFMYGEDLDFCYQLRQNNFSLYFIPYFKITHFQGVSSGLLKTKSITHASRQTKIRSAIATTNAMKIFYQQNLLKNYSKIWQFIIWRGINLLEFYRIFKARYL